MVKKTQCIFFSGIGNIPADVLAKLIFENEGKLVKTTADEKWSDNSPAQIRFELDMSRDDADEIVTSLNDMMEEQFNIDLDTNGQWWLAD